MLVFWLVAFFQFLITPCSTYEIFYQNLENDPYSLKLKNIHENKTFSYSEIVFDNFRWEGETRLFYEDLDSSPSPRAKTRRLESKSLKFERLGLKSDSSLPYGNNTWANLKNKKNYILLFLNKQSFFLLKSI